MLNELDLFYLRQEEPQKSTLLGVRSILLNFDKGISETYKYKLPFFTYQNKMLCYLWIQKKDSIPYIGFVDGNNIIHEDLIKGSRKQMKILLLNPEIDLPIISINEILRKAIYLKKNQNK
jgi:hypothetical protein